MMLRPQAAPTTVTGEVDLDLTLTTVVSARFLHHKVAPSPFPHSTLWNPVTVQSTLQEGTA